VTSAGGVAPGLPSFGAAGVGLRTSSRAAAVSGQPYVYAGNGKPPAYQSNQGGGGGSNPDMYQHGRGHHGRKREKVCSNVKTIVHLASFCINVFFFSHQQSLVNGLPNQNLIKNGIFGDISSGIVFQLKVSSEIVPFFTLSFFKMLSRIVFHSYPTASQAYFALHKTLHEVQNF
jgi:hypothetical protein